METFKKGTVVVESSSNYASILVTAGKLDGKYIIHIQNTSVNEINIQMNDLPVKQLQWICSQNNSYYQTQPQQTLTNGTIKLKLPPSSFNTFSGN